MLESHPQFTISGTPVSIDVVILSFAKNEELRRMTEHCLSTLLASESPDSVVFRVIVVESNHAAPAYDFASVETVYLPPPFNYHRYMNHGIAKGSSPFVAICNNDLSFHPGWATSLLKAFSADDKLYSASPICSLHHPRNGFELHSGIHYGYGVLREISGWCLVFRREMLEITGMLDERFYFWYADDDYARTLKEKRLLHGLVTNSVVDHLDSRTLKTHSTLRQWLMTKRSQYVFERKWSGKSGYYFFRKYLKLYLKVPLYLLGIKKIRGR
ncbi:glycosyltransferase [Pseudomonas daroniae]|uniref:Glycosyltransferase n=1 Tax=Phytopseudomonas daroniae TaxID=2487519 RepID=A0A4Q9QS03_9GAMM|nr:MULTISPECIES: glycosyltransferase [Pseudomonas]TBU83009.1 glycosyltransferase [Pseudomonas sp. FRB 228]TBU83978.1 glycosyltransferase [Pseudomonas daroniae]TBU93156.1 glycosyltransferase [Pseudomonas daroniae]